VIAEGGVVGLKRGSLYWCDAWERFDCLGNGREDGAMKCEGKNGIECSSSWFW